MRRDSWSESADLRAVAHVTPLAPRGDPLPVAVADLRRGKAVRHAQLVDDAHAAVAPDRLRTFARVCSRDASLRGRDHQRDAFLERMAAAADVRAVERAA